MTLSDMRELLISILTSPVAPDASRTETLGELIQAIGLPRPMPEIKMKETLVIVADRLAKSGDTTGAYALLRNPADLLRFIWYRRTGTTLFRRPSYYKKLRDAILAARRPEEAAKYNCRLHFSRSEGRDIAACLNAMEASPSSWPNRCTRAAECGCELSEPRDCRNLHAAGTTLNWPSC